MIIYGQRVTVMNATLIGHFASAHLTEAVEVAAI